MRLKFQQLSIVAIAIIVLLPIEVLGQNYFTMGSTATELKKIQGQPDDINRYAALGHEVWQYGRSRVEISTRSGRVLQWTNRGELRVRHLPGSKVTSSRTFTEGSHKDDVLRLQGTPDQISKYQALGHEVWSFGRSRVEISTRNNRVLQWTDRGNLKVGLRPGKNVTNTLTFTEGSHKDDVLRLQGTPDQISKYPALGHEVWSYGRSRVEISTRDNRVLQWTDRGNLNVGLQPGNNVTSSRTFTEGSHKDDVLRLQGTPDQISKYPTLGHEVWSYGRSRIEISARTSKVLQWTNRGNLKVNLVPGTNVTDSKQFKRGSHKDDVLRLQGTPDQISRYPALGHEVWKFGRSRVEISIVEDLVIDFSDRGNLSVKEGLDNFERKIAYHNKVDNATLYYDDNKSFSNVFSVEIDNDEEVYGVIEEGVIYLYDEDFEPLDTYAYYDENNELEIESFGTSSFSFDTQRLSNTITSIDFSGSVSGSGTAMNFGDITFYDIVTNNGDYIHGSSINFDDMSFDDFYTSEGVSYSGSRMRIGNFTFGDWSSSDGESIYGTSTRIGDFTFHDYTTTDGRTIRGTTMDIGGFSFTDYYDY